MYDVIIIGGGPAGKSAALVLARCRRSVLLIDEGKGRNRASRSLNGYLTRDGTRPSRFLALARVELARYGVKFLAGTVRDAARRADGCFNVTPARGRALVARKLLLATGVQDVLPAIEGVTDFYGVSVHHCPYCDGWEHAGEPLAAYGSGRKAIGLAQLLRVWSDDVVACTNGGRLSAADRSRARDLGIALRTERVVRLEGRAGSLRLVHFESGPPLPRRALFFNTGQFQRSDLPRRLGCEFKKNGGVKTDKRQGTCVAGLFLAGDAEKEVQFVIVAAAQGATAATAINGELVEEASER